MNCIEAKCIHCKIREVAIPPLHFSNGYILDNIIEPYCEVGHKVISMFDDNKKTLLNCADYDMKGGAE